MTWTPAQPICLDISNYQPAVIPPAWKDLGVASLIVGCQDTSHAISQVTTGRALGLDCSWLYSFGTIQSADDTIGGTANALEVASSVGSIRRIWIDCERAALSHSQIASAVIAIESVGYEAGIYTGPYYWANHLANTADYVHLPLWLADYFYSGLPWPAGFNPSTLGLPWDTLSVHQYTSTGTRNDNASGGTTPALAGVSVDYNVIYEEVGMTVEELNRAIMDREALRALASGDYTTVQKALVVLRQAGVIQ